MAIEIKSYNQILGDMIRKVIAETSLNDINTGSVLLTLLEAVASNDFENNTAILNILELLNIDAVKNNDLDARAADYSLSRRTAVKSSGLVTIFNSNITKRTTGLYVIKPAPIAGQTKIYVNDTEGWSNTGSIYIGRGTQSFEGPIGYTSITTYSTYSEITLASALQKDHLISDIVIDSQGEPDRIIAAGTIVKIPANNQNPEIKYVTLRDAVIPAGEDSVSGVEVVALVAGSMSNAGINTISEFSSPPFSGATVTNNTAFTSGKDIETDTELRNRIKSYATTLARGTAPSIVASVIGVSDSDDSKQVASAILTEPVNVGEPSILYIDDGSGFQPSFAGQSVDSLLNNANGSEEFLQLANYPVPRPQVINTAEGPFNIIDGSFLRVNVDGVEETIYFSSDQFINISAATVAEIIVAINSSSTLFKARFANTSKNILIYPVLHDAEIIQVAAIRPTDDSTLYINNLLKFPTDEFSYISLYQNSTRLKEKAKSAELTTTPFAQWNVTVESNIIISVDETPAQDRSFALSDFIGAPSFTSLTLNDWVTAFNNKFAGLTATYTPSQTMVIRSNKEGSSSKIKVTGGSLLNKWFANLETESTGQTAQFELNRQTGNIRILSDILPGDTISAGIEDAKGAIISAVTNSGTYNLSTDSFGRPANTIVVVDSTYCNQISVPLLIGGNISVTNPSSSTMRLISGSIDSFAYLKPSDYVYITPRNSWLNTANTGLFKIKAKGNHTSAGVDTFIDVDNVGVVSEGPITIADSSDIKGFATDGFPQVWRGSYLNNPPAEPISGVIESLNNDISGVLATLYKSNSIKITSASEKNGSIAIPVSISNASVIFEETLTAETGNPSHIATRISDKALVGMFKKTSPVSTNVFLDRQISSDIKGALTADAIPDPSPFSGTYSEDIESIGSLTNGNVSYDDYVSFTRGGNKGQVRSIKAKISGDRVGTQQGTARTEIDHVAGDEFQLIKPISLSTDDSIVVVMDKDATIKTVDIKMARTARINSGSYGSFLPTTTEFSADDEDNEPGINFGNTNVWGTSINNTNFNDYAVWMRARNWYSTGGVSGSNGKMLVRSAQYGPNGEKLRFSIEYPATANQSPTTTYLNTPSYSTHSYFFGSGAPKATALSAGDTVAVSGPYPDDSTNFPNGTVSSGDYYDYTFSNGSLATVSVGDIISIIPGSGLSTVNCGQFSIANKSGLTVRVFNPNASVTIPGTPEVTTITTVASSIGYSTAYQVDTVADSFGSLHLKYFTIYDSQGSVAVWYDVNNTGAPPPPHGANRAIKVSTIMSGDSASVVATKTGIVVGLDNAFAASAILNQVLISNTTNGNFPSGTANTSGFTVTTFPGSGDNTLDGKYFILYDSQGSVAVWYDVGDNGTLEPFHGADRSIRISTIPYANYSSDDVASATAAAINSDPEFTASSALSTITVNNVLNGNVIDSSPGTSGFTISASNGSLPTDETITNPNNIVVFPLTGTDIATIESTVNPKQILEISAIGSSSLTITKSTKEDTYSYVNNSTALAYGHNPNSSSLRGYISLYDGANWIKKFQNTNPNFTVKTDFILNNVAPSVYQMNTAPNYNSVSVGELIKLIPVTVSNVHHHLTQKALSQLPIISNIRISNDRKNVQITSKNLGSSGAIEIIGGNANKSEAYLVSESEVSTDMSGKYLLAKIPAYPDTFNIGDYVKLENDVGVKRYSRLISTDTISVTNPSIGVIEYNYNPKITNISSSTAFSISDVSAMYARPPGYVWRWTHDGSATLAQVRAGDVVMAFGPTLSWDQGNKVRMSGDGNMSGLPIIYVNDASNYFDVINAYGKSMNLSVGLGNTVQICPTPLIKWNLSHAAKVKITSMSRVGSLITVVCANSHILSTGDNVDIIDSDNLTDSTYGPVTVTSANQFTFNYGSGSFSEIESGATAIKSGKIPTRYRVEKLGFNGMTRISRQDGESPRFTDNGVALDDYVVIGGNTFASNNNGRFRVIAVDNNSIIVINDTATDELDTVIPFNNKDLYATWTSNTNTVTGAVGTFKNVNVGDWVKKPEDPDTYYRQVLSISPPTPSLATTITLGGNYGGSTSIAPGSKYDMLNDYDKGVILQDIDDIQVYEGDSAVIGDKLYVQNIVNNNWFNVGNVGNFEIIEVGTNSTTQRPFLRINNSAGSSESNRLMSVNTSGFYIVESLSNKLYTIRQISHVALDDLNEERRSLYLTPHSRSYKFSDSNATSVTHMGKLGYSTDVTTGIDGYLYYTGLLRRVQRIVDGYEPDAENFPGRRAVGGLIETLPPLNRKISVSINVTTNEGVNLGDISSNIKSIIINYISTLGVGEDVVLSEIIASVMQIKGVAAVTFTYPTPNTERITIADNEKATIGPDDIGIA